VWERDWRALAAEIAPELFANEGEDG
jgi:hypothetical protein